MDFALNADQKMTVETAQAMLGEHSSSERVRLAMQTESGIDAALWGLMAEELGWCCLSVPEEFGGVGLGELDLALLLEQLGYHLSCVPFFSTVVLAAKSLEYAAADHAKIHYLPRIAAGQLRATLAWSQLSGKAAVEPSLHRTSEGLQLNGQIPYVLDGASADLLLIPARSEEGQLCLIALPSDAEGLTVRPLQTLDTSRRYANLDLSRVRLTDEVVISEGDVTSQLQKVTDLARIMLAAEQLGGAQRCLDLTVAYTNERVQFGRTIASFQAIKHRCADMMVRIEAARSMVYGASIMAASLDGDSLNLEAAATKSMASEAFFYCAQEAIQLHGGVGFTWEYDPHLYFKRAQASGAWLGAADSLLAGIAAALLDGEEVAHAS